MRLPSLVLFTSAILLITGVLTAQVISGDPVPLRNWAAPTYWQPSTQENSAIKTNSWFSARTAETDVSPQDPITPTNGLVFVGMTPCRLIDTRNTSGFPSPFGPPMPSAGGSGRSFPLQQSTRCTIPSTARAYSLNVTVVPPGPLGFLTIWPTGVTMPVVSTLNDMFGAIIANAAVVPAGTPNGSISIYVSSPTDVVVDINGYYVTPTTNGGIITSDNNNGLTSAPAVGCSVATNIASSSAINISATNYYILMNGSAALGSTSAGGASGLDVWPCYQPPGGIWTTVSGGIFGLKTDGRMTVAVDWIFGPYTTLGSYKFGICALQCNGTGTWNSNEYFTITSLVYTQNFMTSDPANIPTR
jgi:hypothetical protein